MNTVNRVVIIVASLVIMVVCTLALLFPVRALNATAHQLGALADYVAGLGRPFRDVGWFIRVAVCVLFALTVNTIGILLIIAEVHRPAPRFIRVEKATTGDVRVSISSIADQLKYEIGQLPGVLHCKLKVSAGRGGVVIGLDVEATSEIDVPASADQIVETARLVIEKMGLKLARPPAINLRTVPHPRVPPTPATRPSEAAAGKPEGTP